MLGGNGREMVNPGEARPRPYKTLTRRLLAGFEDLDKVRRVQPPAHAQSSSAENL